jgi:hypothetical protein
VDAVMEGIEVTFEDTLRRWPLNLRDVFEPCKMDPPTLSGALAKLAAGQDGKHPMPKLIFTAYETACREQKGK